MKTKIVLIALLIFTLILTGCSSNETKIEEELANDIVDSLNQDKIEDISEKETIITKEIDNLDEAEKIIKEVEENLEDNEEIDYIIVGIQGHDEEIVTENIEDWKIDENGEYDSYKDASEETKEFLTILATPPLPPVKEDPTLEELYDQPLVAVECTDPSDRACVDKLRNLKGVWYTGDDTEEGGLGFFIDIKGQNVIEIGYPYSEMIYYIEVVGRKETQGHFLLRTKATDYSTGEKENMTIEIKRIGYNVISFKINNN